jgi:phosphatidylglycerol:prolipoprotein diacylglycerol transferase
LAFQSQITDHHLIDAVSHHLLNQYVPVEQAGNFLGQWTDTVTGMTLSQIPAGALEVATEAAKLGHTLPVYPTQLMESLGELAIFGILLVVRKKKYFNGQVLACYAMLYAILRTVTETFRGDEERGRIFGMFPSVPRHAWYNISTSQLISLAIFGLGVTLWARFGRKNPQDLDLGVPSAA